MADGYISRIKSHIRMRGASALTYGLIVGLIAVSGIVATQTTGEEVTCMFNKTSGELIRANGNVANLDVGCGGIALVDGQFTPVIDAEPGSLHTSNTLSLTGFQGAVNLSVGGGATLVINGADTGQSSVTAQAGDNVALRLYASGSWLTRLEADLSIANAQDIPWSVTTRDVDEEPDAFTLSNVSDADPSTTTTTTTPALAGFDGPVTASIGSSDGGSPQFRVNGGAWVTSADVYPGDVLEVRMDSHGDFDGIYTATLTIGTLAPIPWQITTRSQNTTPGAFSFVDQTGVGQSSTISSNAVAVNGFEGPVTASCDAGCTAIARNGSWGGSSVSGFYPGDTIAIQLTSAGDFDTPATASVTLGNTTSGIWTVTTAPRDTAPDAFAFNDQTEVSQSTLITSNTITLAGFDGPLDATCSNCTAIARNGGWGGTSMSGFMAGDAIAIRQTSGSGLGQQTQATITVGDTTSSPWSVTTIAPDETPNSFSFSNQSNVEPSQTITSNAVTVSGFDGPLTATCGSNCTAIARNGSWGGTSVSGFNPGDTITIRMTSSSSYSSGRTGYVALGTTQSSGWTTTTRAQDTTPSFSGNFNSLSNQNFNALVQSSNTVTLTSFDGPLSVSMNTTSYDQAFSINGGSWTTSGSIYPGDNIRVRMRTAGASNSSRTMYVYFNGGNSRSFTTTTKTTGGFVDDYGRCYSITCYPYVGGGTVNFNTGRIFQSGGTYIFVSNDRTPYVATYNVGIITFTGSGSLTSQRYCWDNNQAPFDGNCPQCYQNDSYCKSYASSVGSSTYSNGYARPFQYCTSSQVGC